MCFLHAMGFGILQAVFQRLINCWCDSAFILGQQRVTATTSQSVCITNNIALDNLDRQLQMTNHRLYNSYLLPVFLTKISTIGLYDIEQAADYLTHAIKVTWTMSTLHHSRDGGILKLTGIRRRIHLFNAGCQNIVSTTLLQQFAVSIQCAGIVLQIVFVVKLCRIDKYRHHCYPIFLHTATHQRGVSFMQCSHRRYKTYFFSLLAIFKQLVLKVNNLIKYFHFKLIVYKIGCKITTFLPNKKEIS